LVKGALGIPASTENAYVDLIRSLIETYRLTDEPFTIEPTSEALEVMNGHYNEIVKRRHDDLRDVTIYAARWNEQAWRIAVVLHAAQRDAHAHEHRLELDTAKRAIELADWFAAQQLEILGCHGNVQYPLLCADRAVALADRGRCQISLDAESDPPAMAAAFVSLQHARCSSCALFCHLDANLADRHRR